MRLQRKNPRGRLPVALCLTLTALGAVVSCAPRRESLDDRYAPARARAIVQAAEAGDAEAVPKIVALLEDDDRGVRMFAILALQRLTGTTLGYDYRAPEPRRAAAVNAWRSALRDGTVRLRAQAPPSSDSEVRRRPDTTPARAESPRGAGPTTQPRGGSE